MDKIIIHTQAYNAEKTIKRTIESVLNQTDDNFIYYILDNGSDDSTGEIIAEYAGQDNRIVPLRNEVNNVWPKGVKWHDFLRGHREDCYFSMLDADDEYAPDFFEKMRIFVTENNLDVATCGTDWVDGETGEIIRHKVPAADLILEGTDFACRFPVYRNFMVTGWGAVFSVRIVRGCTFHWARKALNFSDTAFCMEAFHRAERAGVLAESLHKYYIGHKTGSYQYSPGWFRACNNLYDISREYLLCYGPISRQNKDYLYVLFLILIKYILPRIQNADIGLPEKLSDIHKIFKDRKTQYLLRHWSEVGIYSDKGEFLCEMEEWLLSRNDWEEHQIIISEIIFAMNGGKTAHG